MIEAMNYEFLCDVSSLLIRRKKGLNAFLTKCICSHFNSRITSSKPKLKLDAHLSVFNTKSKYAIYAMKLDTTLHHAKLTSYEYKKNKLKQLKKHKPAIPEIYRQEQNNSTSR